jgi:hypothetical protein
VIDGDAALGQQLLHRGRTTHTADTNAPHRDHLTREAAGSSGAISLPEDSASPHTLRASRPCRVAG